MKYLTGLLIAVTYAALKGPDKDPPADDPPHPLTTRDAPSKF